jgi:acetyltransferase-like isoleucine patch superfamily enzyme
MSIETGWAEKQNLRIERRLELLRGWLLRRRGARSGLRFGLGRGVVFHHPEYFCCQNDVSIGDYSFLHCLAAKGVNFGSRTSIDRNLWLHCGGKSGNMDHGFFSIGSDSFIGCNAVIGAGGGITIGDHVLIGQCVNFHAENHLFGSRDELIAAQGLNYKGIRIGNDVWIGSKVTILDGVVIEDGAVIGAGAIVNVSIPAYAVAVGTPARVVGYRGEGKYAYSNLP